MALAAREKLMLRYLGPVFAVLVLGYAVKGVVWAPFREVRDERRELTAQRDELNQNIKNAQKRLTDNPDLVELMLGPANDSESPEMSVDTLGLTDENYRPKIDNLLKQIESKFTYSTLDRPKDGKFKFGKRGRDEISTLVYSVEGQGNLESIMRLVLSVYQSSDLLYVKELSLAPSGARDIPPSESMKATVKLETLVVPRVETLERLVKRPVPAQLKGPRSPMNGDYSILLTKKPFDLFRKPAPPSAVVRSNGRPIYDPNRPSGESLPPPDRDWVIVMTMMDEDASEVRVIRPRGKAPSPTHIPGASPSTLNVQYFKEKEEMDGGVLVLVHRDGAVVCKKDEQGVEQYWFYPLGKSWSESLLLEQASDYEDVQLAMKKVLESRTPAETPALPLSPSIGAAGLVPMGNPPDDSMTDDANGTIEKVK